MKVNVQSYLLDIAQEEAASKEAELHSLRNSLRYRVGGWALELFPPGRRTFVVLWRLTRLCISHIRGRGAPGNLTENLVLPEEAREATTLVLGTTLPEGIAGNVWRTDSAQLMALRLDSGPTASTLVMRLPASEVLRRIARAKLDGTDVIWWPEDSIEVESALVGYARGHAHECQEKFEA